MIDVRTFPDGWDTSDATASNSSKASMFFWYFPAQEVSKDPSAPPPPLVIWLQGGPGSSSLIGLFYEMGPLSVSEDLKIGRNPDTWNKNYSMLFIDNPVGTGYSYVYPLDMNVKENDTPPTTTRKWMPEEEATHATLRFRATSSSSSKNSTTSSGSTPGPLYIFGESYAGKYVPYIGVGIGNGLTDPASQVVTHAPHALALGLVSNRQAKQMDLYAQEAAEYARKGNWSASLLARAKEGDVQNSWEAMEKLASLGGVKCSLNVPAWVAFAKDPAVYYHLAEDVMKPAAHIGNLTSGTAFYHQTTGLRIWIGRGGTRFLEANRTVWKVNGHVAGFLTEHDVLRRVEVMLAGHLAPMDAGPSTLDMLHSFITFAASF
ncbi:Alpha/Beta hydrolase protein [Chytridium lagenaria]|nr:Alpha/Beta hydrolase protein [Chytridium lagenaria]